MGLRISTAAGIILGIVVSMAVAERCLAQARTATGGPVAGYGNLPWGTTVEEAEAVHPDLYFERFAIEGAKEAPSRVFHRRNENPEIEGVAFDYMEYRFRENRFYMIRAVMISRVGPRSLVTRSEESFDLLRRSLTRRYGAPSKFDESYFTDFVTVVRIAEWDRIDATIVLEYRGTGETNEDQLTFVLREGGKH